MQKDLNFITKQILKKIIMNEDLLLSWLKSDSAYLRVRAARLLAQDIDQTKLSDISIAYQSEHVPWVKMALKKTLDIYENTSTSDEEKKELETIEPDDLKEYLEAAKSEAFNESIGLMLHELEPAIGALRVQAKEDIPGFENSGTNEELERIDELLEVFSSWRRLERIPKIEEANLTTIVIDLAEKYVEPNISAQFIGDSDCLVRTDKTILDIALTNAVRNSVEALNQSKSSQNPTITFTYGTNDSSFWVSVADNGPGLSSEVGRLIKSRVTTKPGHHGLGLALVSRAVNALGGKFTLENRKAGGAEFYLEAPDGDTQ